jgi:hypothetical protein
MRFRCLVRFFKEESMKSAYYINGDEFVVENYNKAKPFASFLPAIAGLYGKPMWVYYVNRGQCIASMGVDNKDHAVMEFQPANKAYRQTGLQGFRTFMKIKDSDGTICYEPFRDPHGQDIVQRMHINAYDLTIEEINNALGIKTEVMYCTVPGETIAGLIRRVRITKLSGRQREIEMLDGVPIVLPFYLSDHLMKNESNLRQAWINVDHSDKVPFYNVKVLPADVAETVFMQGGNFYLNFDGGAGGDICIAKTVVDPVLVFGNVTDFTYPEGFYDGDFQIPGKQASVGLTPCGFGFRRIVLTPGDADTAYTIVGKADAYEGLMNFIETKLSVPYIEAKIGENRDLIESLKRHALTVSGCREFDLYAGQTFLDNTLRGGYPICLGGKHVFYVYGRKHGDLEREYNFFQVDSTCYSQGNSHFRDVNQNRRNGVRFFPYVGDTDLKTFFDLIQLDGFNPLVLKGAVFTIDRERAAAITGTYFGEAGGDLIAHMGKPFTPGSLLGVVEHSGLDVKKGTLDGFIGEIFAEAEKSEQADFQEGYWVDHWTYNTDLLEQYIAVFPDKVVETLFSTCDYTYYDPCEMVAPRDEKYVLTEGGIRQFGALKKIPGKLALIRERRDEPHKVRIEHGKGAVYRCSLLSKIICMLVNKMASLDPEGVGIEMEAGKPGWCDALNGMPGVIGSSINENAEVKRLAALLLDLLQGHRIGDDREIMMPAEVYRFFEKVRLALVSAQDDFTYWNLTYIAKEEYRESVAFGIAGKEQGLSVAKIRQFLEKSIARIDRGLMKAYNKESGLYYTYFINEAIEYEAIKDGDEILHSAAGHPRIRVKAFRQRPIPYFLEGIVHMLRIETDTERAGRICDAVKRTGLYDEALRMYKVNDYIMDETKEIGRQNVFPRGWLENEAVFLHMEYKYLLEILRCGLYDRFFKEMKNALVPFQDPGTYGRSILENSSFIASSAHPDPRVHGRGYQSRLSGASAEFLTMWLLMTVGKRPFFLDESGALCLRFIPALPGWLFTSEEKEIGPEGPIPAHCFAFYFLGDILTVYHNQAGKDTYGEDAAQIKRYVITMKDDSVLGVDGAIIPIPLAGYIRTGLASRIDIYLE